MTTAIDSDYEQAVTEQLRSHGSVNLTAEALAFLLGAVGRAPEIPHPDLLLLWRSLVAARPDLAADTWGAAWHATKPADRIALAVVVANIPAVDPTIITNR